MQILNKAQILKLSDYLQLSDTLIEAFKDLESGKINMPPRTHVDMDGNTLLLMPCYNGKYFVTKMVSLFPNNTQSDHPALYGTVVLNDGQTGRPLALLEGSALTGLRTGAIGGLGIKYTTPENISNIGLVGTGEQGFYQLLFAARQRTIKNISLYNPNIKESHAFEKRISAMLPDINIHHAKSALEMVKHSEVIITATTASTPVLPRQKDLYRNKHIIAVGSYRPNMQEIPDEAFMMADQIIVDTEHAAQETGDVLNPIKQGLIRADQIIPMSKIITKQATLADCTTTIYKSVGMALFDLAAAQYFYEKAQQSNDCTEIEF